MGGRPLREVRERTGLSLLAGSWLTLATVAGKISTRGNRRSMRLLWILLLTLMLASTIGDVSAQQAGPRLALIIGNANYPGGGIDGSLRMLVIVRFDGTLEEVRILESSGHRQLDVGSARRAHKMRPL